MNTKNGLYEHAGLQIGTVRQEMEQVTVSVYLHVLWHAAFTTQKGTIESVPLQNVH